MNNLFYSTKRGKARGFWLFNVEAKNIREATAKARKEARSYGDVVSYIRRIRTGEYAVYGGSR